MSINLKNRVKISDIKNDFSKVSELVDENGSAVILENDNPKYVIVDVRKYIGNADKIEMISDRILNENMEAFLELAK